ncbi:MAG: ThuA domain-containing protein [Gemmatimonadaceae bacterium]
MLVFSKTAGFRHASIEAGIAAVKKLGDEQGFAVDATEDATAFTTPNLRRYRAVVFLSTTGDGLNNVQEAQFERYIRAGGGWGWHSPRPTRSTSGRGMAALLAPTSTDILAIRTCAKARSALWMRAIRPRIPRALGAHRRVLTTSARSIRPSTLVDIDEKSCQLRRTVPTT